MATELFTLQKPLDASRQAMRCRGFCKSLRRLCLYLIVAWIGVFTPIVFTGIVVRAAMTLNWDALVPAIMTLLIAFAAMIIYAFVGRVSIQTAFGLLIATMVPLIAAVVFSFLSIFSKHLLWGVFVFLLALTLALMISPEFLQL